VVPPHVGLLVGVVLLLRAFSFQTPWYAPFLIQTLLAIAVSVPVAPGAVGQFHAPFVVGILMLAGNATPDEAKAAAIAAHLINMIPLFITGIACFLIDRRRLFARRHDRDLPGCDGGPLPAGNPEPARPEPPTV